MAEQLVVIGGVAAGSKAAARARRVNPDLYITLFQDEAEVSYTACGQPYFLSGLIAKREALIIRRPADFAEEGIEVKVKHRVTALNTDEHTVTVHDREHDRTFAVPYDRLIIATGARSVLPEVRGCHLHLDGVATLRSLAELDHFRSVLERSTSVWKPVSAAFLRPATARKAAIVSPVCRSGRRWATSPTFTAGSPARTPPAAMPDFPACWAPPSARLSN